MEYEERKVWFYFDVTGSLGEADCIKSVAQLRKETKGAFKGFKLYSRERNAGQRRGDVLEAGVATALSEEFR